MPVYFFHVRHEQGLDEDFEGVSFESVADARDSAVATLREVIADELRAARDVDISGIEITDASGAVVATVGLNEAVIEPLLKA